MTSHLDIIRKTVRDCRACHLVEQCNGPVALSGRAQATYLVVGEAPGRNEDEQGEPFVGGAGRLLRKQLAQAGIFQREVAYTNVVRCRPPDNRTPYSSEIEACWHNLLVEMAAVEARIVLLAGATALNVFRPDLQISKHSGRPMMLDEGRVGLGVMHPAAAMRQPGLEKYIERVVRDAKKRAVKGLWVDWPDDCVVCGEDGEVADSMGVFYCAGHESKRDAWRGKVARQRALV